MHQSWVATSSEGENGDGINSRTGLEEDFDKLRNVIVRFVH